MAPWSPFFGHLAALLPLMKTLPEDRHQQDLLEKLCQSHEGDGDSVTYVDTWPFSEPLMVVCSPVLAAQACGPEYDLIKPPLLHDFFNQLAGGTNMFTMNGDEWRCSRALFNSGFSATYILQQTSHIVNEAEIYVNILRQHARKGDMFSLDDITCWYLMDVIGAVSLDSRLRSQTQHNPLASAMRSQIRWHVVSSERYLRFHPARSLVEMYNNYQMNDYIGKELDKRYAEWTKDETSSRSIMLLVLQEYMAQQKDKSRPKKLDPVFKKWAIIQIRLFIFAGHDSTASAICCMCLLPLSEVMGTNSSSSHEGLEMC